MSDWVIPEAFIPPAARTDPDEIRRLKVKCQTCGKKVRQVGLREHVRFMHEGGKEQVALDAFGDRILTEQELDAIDLRADIDYMDRRTSMPRERLHRAAKDRDLLLGHIRALGRLPAPTEVKP